MRDISDKCIIVGDVTSPGLYEFSVSKIKTWRRCHKKFEYKYVRKLTPKKKAVALTMGTWLHKCLEVKDNGLDWRVALRELKQKEYDTLFEEERAELGPLPQEVFRLMRSYEQIYLEEDKEWKTVSTEQDFMVRIDGTRIVVTGKIDKIALHVATDKLWIWEHKSMTTLPSEEFRITDIQTAVYDYILSKILPFIPGYEHYDSKKVGGVMFDYLRKKAPAIPQELKGGGLSKRRNIDTDKYTYMAQVKKMGLNPADYQEFADEIHRENRFFRRIPMPKHPVMVKAIMREFIRSATEAADEVEYGEQSLFTRSLDWTCDRPRCEYRDLCISELNGVDVEFMIKSQFERRSEKDEQEDARTGDD